MNQFDLEALKRQIKDELLAEMEKNKTAYKNEGTWNQIKMLIEERMSHLGGPELYQLTSAFSTIIRVSLGIRTIRYVPYSKEDQVISFVKRLLEEMDQLRNKQKHPTTNNAETA